VNIEPNARLRLQFLSRVVGRESHHLNRTKERLFGSPFTIDVVSRLAEDDDLSEQVEAFVSRFARLQDTLGDKFIPQLLTVMGEQRSTLIDNLDVAERLGWLASADEWLTMRQLRNQMVHEYIEDPQILISAIQAARDFVPELISAANKLQAELQLRGWQE